MRFITWRAGFSMPWKFFPVRCCGKRCFRSLHMWLDAVEDHVSPFLWHAENFGVGSAYH